MQKPIQSALASLALVFAASTSVEAAFMPTIDEFWVMRNGTQQFRDSFSDNVLPPSGPQDGLGGNPSTYSVTGAAGMTSEAGGKLTMTPGLGDPVLIQNGYADTFTGALKLRTTTTGNSNFLGFGESFEVHGLYDLSSVPSIVGQTMGIAVSDRNLGTPFNEGDDMIDLSLRKSSSTGNVVVSLNELDFINDTVDNVANASIQGFLASAAQVELIISKAANTDEIGASFILYDAANAIIHQQSLSTFSTAQNENLKIYEGESYTRAMFQSRDQVFVPEPATLAVLGLGIGALGWARRRRG